MAVIRELSVDLLDHALGIDNTLPQFGWKLKSKERYFIQEAYQIRVRDTLTGAVLWDSGKVNSKESSFISYKGEELQSRQCCEWNVRVWGGNGQVTGWSESAFFEMGLLHPEDWKGKWIEPVQRKVQKEPAFDMQNQLEEHGEESAEERLNPCQFCRREFAVEKQVKRARVYITAHGIYQLQLNGKKAGDLELTPGFTSYSKFLQYQTYDVTQMLHPGTNVIGLILADGWYAGRIGMIGDSAQYGDKLGALLQLEISYADGSSVIIGSDERFVSSTGEYLYSDLYIGEKADYRLCKTGWSEPGFDMTNWTAVECADYGCHNLAAQLGEPVRAVEERPAVSVIKTPKGELVLDFGQVVAGRVRLEAEGEAGTEIILEHSEVLDKDGNYLNNIVGRNKDQRDIFILKGDGKEILEPTFTFHGFRYVKVCGYPGELAKEAAKAIVLSSNLKKNGEFECSDARLNRLQQNIFYSQQGNMISIPTDCPQRERAGWTGDIQIFAPTACHNMNMYSFLNRWLRSVRLEQYENGGIPNIVPFIPSYNAFGDGEPMPASAGCGDACVIVPWVIYEQYGNIEVLRENYQTMKKWVEYIRISAENGCAPDVDPKDQERVERQKYLWNTAQNLGDWLIPSLVKVASVENMMKCSALTQEYISSCFYVYSAEILSKAAAVLGRKEDQQYYSELVEKVRKAFSDEYIKEDGYLGDYQGVYVMALQFEMAAPEKRKLLIKRLAELIRNNGYRLDTGFVSTPFLLDVLCKNGYQEIAYRLLFQNQCPSWLYEVEHGATSIWENWNAVNPDGTTLPVSYNHYAFGCVGEWMYRYLGGINAVKPGYRKIRIAPHVDCGLTSVRTERETVYGRIVSSWRLDDSQVEINVTIPENTTAEIILPGAAGLPVRESGVLLETSQDVHISKETENGDIVCEAGSGIYQFYYQKKS